MRQAIRATHRCPTYSRPSQMASLLPRADLIWSDSILSSKYVNCASDGTCAEIRRRFRDEFRLLQPKMYGHDDSERNRKDNKHPSHTSCLQLVKFGAE